MQSNGITFNTSNSNFPSCCFPPDEEPRRVSSGHINKCLPLLATISPLQNPTVSPRHHGWFPTSPHLSHQSSHWICVVVYSQVAVCGILKQYCLCHHVPQSLIVPSIFIPSIYSLSLEPKHTSRQGPDRLTRHAKFTIAAPSSSSLAPSLTEMSSSRGLLRFLQKAFSSVAPLGCRTG